MKGNKAFLILLGVVLVSGCVGGTTNSNVQFSQTDGAVIQDFAFDQKEIYEGDSAILSFKVQNIGAKNMDGDSQVWIYGPRIGAEDEKWHISSSAKTSYKLETKGFLPPDTKLGIPGSMDMQAILLTAPKLKLPENMKKDYTFYTRVCYPYSTSSFTSITAFTRNEQKISVNDVKPTEAITRASAGPIQLKLLSGNMVRSGKTLSIVYEITNVGKGFATKQDPACTSQVPDVASDKKDSIEVTVKVDGETVTDCTKREVTIRNGKGSLFCKHTLKNEDNSPKTEFVITADAKYNYFLSKETSITVIGNGETE